LVANQHTQTHTPNMHLSITYKHTMHGTAYTYFILGFNPIRIRFDTIRFLILSSMPPLVCPPFLKHFPQPVHLSLFHRPPCPDNASANVGCVTHPHASIAHARISTNSHIFSRYLDTTHDIIIITLLAHTPICTYDFMPSRDEYPHFFRTRACMHVLVL